MVYFSDFLMVPHGFAFLLYAASVESSFCFYVGFYRASCGGKLLNRTKSHMWHRLEPVLKLTAARSHGRHDKMRGPFNNRLHSNAPSQSYKWVYSRLDESNGRIQKWWINPLFLNWTHFSKSDGRRHYFGTLLFTAINILQLETWLSTTCCCKELFSVSESART